MSLVARPKDFEVPKGSILTIGQHRYTVMQDTILRGFYAEYLAMEIDGVVQETHAAEGESHHK